IRRLLRLRLADTLRRIAKQLPLDARAQFAWTGTGSVEALRLDIVEHALDALLGPDHLRVRERGAFEALAGDLAQRLGRAANERALLVQAALHGLAATAPLLQPPILGFAAANYDDLRAQLARLVPPTLGRDVPDARLAEYPRYLKAMALRTQRLQSDPRRDQQRMLVVQQFEQRLAALPDDPASAAEREPLRWLLEELRVSLFAQDLGTRETVSDKRVEKRLHALERALQG